MPSRGLRVLVAIAAIAAIAAGAAADAAAADFGSLLRKGASEARSQCHGRMHHDADEYRACIDAMLAAGKRPPAERLGIEFFGWVGAINSSRIGLEGAEDAAFAYLRAFRRTQMKLGVRDVTLCESVPGDCEARLARMRQMEREVAVAAGRKKSP